MLREAKLGTMVCPKCFAEIPDTSAFCMECGSRIREDTTDPLYAEGSDREVYPELARANLLRMQGKYEEAIEVCRRIMGRFPATRPFTRSWATSTPIRANWRTQFSGTSCWWS